MAGLCGDIGSVLQLAPRGAAASEVEKSLSLGFQVLGLSGIKAWVFFRVVAFGTGALYNNGLPVGTFSLFEVLGSL